MDSVIGKMGKHFNAKEIEWLKKRMPKDWWKFTGNGQKPIDLPANGNSSVPLADRVSSAKEFLNMSSSSDELEVKNSAEEIDAAARHIHASDSRQPQTPEQKKLQAAREALGKSGDAYIRPPKAPERESLTPKPGKESLTTEQAAGILETPEWGFSRYAIQNGISVESDGKGGLKYSASDVLALANKKGLIAKNAVKESLRNHRNG